MRRRHGLALGMVTVLVGCGIPTDGSPRDLAAERLPAALTPADSTTTTTVADTPDDDEPIALTVYLVDGGTQIIRATSRSAPDDSPRQMIDQLRRLTDDDREAGFRTLITDDVEIVRPTATEERNVGITLRLALSDEFYALEGPNRSLAAAQIVFTVTAPARFDAVLFLDGDEEPQLIPTSAGELPENPRPMVRQDFDGFNALVIQE